MPPELEEMTVEAKSTALVILDIQNLNCNEEKRSRCEASLGEREVERSDKIKFTYVCPPILYHFNKLSRFQQFNRF